MIGATALKVVKVLGCDCRQWPTEISVETFWKLRQCFLPIYKCEYLQLTRAPYRRNHIVEISACSIISEPHICSVSNKIRRGWSNLAEFLCLCWCHAMQPETKSFYREFARRLGTSPCRIDLLNCEHDLNIAVNVESWMFCWNVTDLRSAARRTKKIITSGTHMPAAYCSNVELQSSHPYPPQSHNEAQSKRYLKLKSSLTLWMNLNLQLILSLTSESWSESGSESTSAEWESLRIRTTNRRWRIQLPHLDMYRALGQADSC